VSISGSTWGVGVVKCRETCSDSGVKVAANYRSELGLNEL
jgi:hypothetical protein